MIESKTFGERDSEEQKRVFQQYADNYNKTNKSKLSTEQVYNTLNESQMATYAWSTLNSSIIREMAWAMPSGRLQAFQSSPGRFPAHQRVINSFDFTLTLNQELSNLSGKHRGLSGVLTSYWG
jgi:hypothetical protein